MTDQGPTGWNGRPGEPHQGWAAGLRFGDRYLVERLIGEGGWAETYRGQDLLLGRPVALKLLRSQFAADPALVDRFEREARIAAAISHPNVVAVYDFGTQDGIFFIALQFIAGEDLKHVVVRRGRLPVEDAVGVTREILQGLGAIHRAGIVHRDVKPQNVLLGEDGIVRITDFGIAHQSLATRVTTQGDAMGTASYMAPEQARGEDVSPATDVYSLGVVLYELLTGRLPFEREHAMATLLAHLQEPPPAPRVIAPDAAIPPWLEAIVLRAMAKQPADRFSSAPAMLAALTAAGGEGDGAATTQRFEGATDPLGSATLVVPGLRARPATAAGPAMGARRVAGSGTDGMPPGTPPVGPIPQPSRRGWGVAIVLVLVAFLAVGAVVAASIWDGDGGGGGGETATATGTVRTLPALATVTDIATEVIADEEEPTPTEPTQPTETSVPTLPPTATREATITPSPTDEPTEVPTEPPPTPTETPGPPTQTPVPVEEEPPIDPETEDPVSGGADLAGGPILLSAESWQGGAGKKKDDTPRGNGNGNAGNNDDVASIEARAGPKATATVMFTLNQVPAEGVMIELQARPEQPNDGPALLSIAVNDSATSEPVDISATGDAWGLVQIPVAAAALVVGENRIVASAQEADDARGRATVILLGDVTVASQGAAIDPGAGIGSGSESVPNVEPEETPESVVVDDADVPDTEGGSSEPTIAPR